MLFHQYFHCCISEEGPVLIRALLLDLSLLVASPELGGAKKHVMPLTFVVVLCTQMGL